MYKFKSIIKEEDIDSRDDEAFTDFNPDEDSTQIKESFTSEQPVLRIIGWSQKMLKNDKAIIFDLVTTAGSAGLEFILLRR